MGFALETSNNLHRTRNTSMAVAFTVHCQYVSAHVSVPVVYVRTGLLILYSFAGV
jgi:hypothetical protein